MDHFERSGLVFDVRDTGDEAGVTAVLLHGFPQQPSAFDTVAHRLNDAGVRTLVPTQRGYTAAARPRSRRAYRGAEIVADVVALLDAAGLEQAHVVGHDWGGLQVWRLAARHPERVASLTVLSTPHPAALTKSMLLSDQGLRSAYMGFFQLPRLPEMVLHRRLRKILAASWLPERYLEEYCAAMARPGALTGALNWYRGIPLSAPGSVSRITVPTIYLWGRHDFALGRAAAQRTGRYVDAPYQFRDLDTGHWLPEVMPDVVTEAVLEGVNRAGC